MFRLLKPLNRFLLFFAVTSLFFCQCAWASQPVPFAFWKKSGESTEEESKLPDGALCAQVILTTANFPPAFDVYMVTAHGASDPTQMVYGTALGGHKMTRIFGCWAGQGASCGGDWASKDTGFLSMPCSYCRTACESGNYFTVRGQTGGRFYFALFGCGSGTEFANVQNNPPCETLWGY